MTLLLPLRLGKRKFEDLRGPPTVGKAASSN
jgi:hypothetical protein